MYVFPGECMTYVCSCAQRPEDSVWSPEAGVRGSHEPADMGSVNGTLVLWESNNAASH